MKSIQTTSPNLDQIFDALSNAFDCEVFILANQNYKIEIPKSLGEGYIEGYEYCNGIRYLCYNCKFYDDVEIKFASSDLKVLNFFYTVQGKFSTSLDQKIIYNFKPYQSTVLNHPPQHSLIITFKRYEELRVSCLSINSLQFLNSRKYDRELDLNLKNLFNTTTKPFLHHCHYDLQLLEVYEDIKNFNGKDFLRIIYTEGKILELISLHLKEYIRSIQTPLPPLQLMPYEIENLKKIPRLIEENIGNRPKIRWYAQEIGMNINKFQKGFQELYKETVNGYIQNKRLSISKDLLVETNLAIGEIIEELGLRSKSHFSKIFKTRYHMSPSDYRKKYQKDLSKNRNHVQSRDTFITH